MAIKNELSILTKAEQLDLYSPPLLSLEQQRLYFTPNEIELTELKSIRLTGRDRTLLMKFEQADRL